MIWLQVEKLKQCLEDITSVCILEGFQKQEHLVMVDQVLKELGRAEAGLASKGRKPVMTSNHFIVQYFTSFCEDPILKSLEKESEGDVDEKAAEEEDTASGYLAAREALKVGNWFNSNEQLSRARILVSTQFTRRLVSTSVLLVTVTRSWRRAGRRGTGARPGCCGPPSIS